MAAAVPDRADPRQGALPVPFLRALNGQRRIAVMGCERVPFTAVFAAGGGLMFLAFATMSPVALAAGLLFWTAGTWALRKLHRFDPMFWRLYVRSLRYKRFYPARATRWGRKHRSMR